MAKRLRRSRADLEAYWRRLIEEQQQSGQTICGFCREQGLTESAFHFWKRELGVRRRKPATEKHASDEATPTFVPVSVIGSMTSPITLELGGATLRIEAGVDISLLRTVLAALRAS